MKFAAFLCLLLAMGLGYTYYQKTHVPVVVEPPPVVLSEAEKRALKRQELTDKITGLRAELTTELIDFRKKRGL